MIDKFSLIIGIVIGWSMAVICCLIDYKLKWGLFKEGK